MIIFFFLNWQLVGPISWYLGLWALSLVVQLVSVFIWAPPSLLRCTYWEQLKYFWSVSFYYDNTHTMIQTPKWSSSENNHSSTLIVYRNTWFLRLPYSIPQIFMQGVVRCWITCGYTAQYVWALWLWLSLWGSNMSTNLPPFSWLVS